MRSLPVLDPRAGPHQTKSNFPEQWLPIHENNAFLLMTILDQLLPRLVKLLLDNRCCSLGNRASLSPRQTLPEVLPSYPWLFKIKAHADEVVEFIFFLYFLLLFNYSCGPFLPIPPPPPRLTPLPPPPLLIFSVWCCDLQMTTLPCSISTKTATLGNCKPTLTVTHGQIPRNRFLILYILTHSYTFACPYT